MTASVNSRDRSPFDPALGAALAEIYGTVVSHGSIDPIALEVARLRVARAIRCTH